MSKNYTPSEVEAAVTKLVRSSIRYPYGALGVRDTGTTFNDMQDAAAGVFILTPNAPFYVVYLGAQRLLGSLETELETVASILDAIVATSRRVKAIDNLAPLVNARVALSALESAATVRTRGFAQITSVPAFQRFIENTSRFLGESSSNVRGDGEVLQTPQGARASLPALVRVLIEAHVELVRKVNLLALALENFESLKLGQFLASSVISNARQTLQDRVEELTALDPEGRNKLIREVTLDILASRAAVTSFGSLATPSTFVVLEGEGNLYTDSTHLGDSARLESDILGPYPILAENQELLMTVDGGPTLSILVQGSFVAFLDGTAPEPFNIYGPSNPPPSGYVRNDHFVVEVPGYPTLDVLLTQANLRTVESVVADINAGITTQPIVAEAILRPEKFFGVVDLVVTGSPSDLDFTFNPSTAGDWTVLPIEEGDKVLVDDVDSSSDGAVYEVDVGGITATTLTCTQLSGPAPSNESAMTIRVGPPARFIRIRIADGDELQALADRQVIRIPDEDVDSASTTLGFFPLQEIQCRSTTARDVANSVNVSFGAQADNVARVSAEAVFVSQETWEARSEPTDPLRISLYRWRGIADYTGGLSAVFSIGGSLAGDFNNVQVGDIVVLRSAAVSEDVDRYGTITAVSGGGCTATFVGPAISASVGETVEVGPATATAIGTTCAVTEGTANDGDYEVRDNGITPLDLVIDRPLVAYQNLGGLPYYFTAELGQYRVDFLSTSVQTDSALSADGVAAPLFFTTVPKAAVGDTPHVLLPSNPKTIELGDTLEYYSTQFNSPSSVFTIVGLELSSLLVEVSPAIPMDQTPFDLSLEQQIPFVRIRKKRKDTYDAFKAELEEWLALPENDVQYFRNLNRFINPLTSNSNPTASDVGTAKAHVQFLADALATLQTILNAYQAEVVPRVDTLLDSFQQKGAARATDLLLEGQFAAFFGLTQSGMSYLGNVLELMKEVQREDLPIRKVKRPGVRDQEILIASYEEPDAEFDLSDIQDFSEPDFSGEFTESGGGKAY